MALIISACSNEDNAPESVASEVPQVVQPCEDHVFEEIPLTVCTALPGEHTIRTALKPQRGVAYRSLAAFAADRSEDDQPVIFALNGGMFDDEGDPIGYYVEDGERLHQLNRQRGPGNFHLMPNGVFFGTDGVWEIRTSDDFFDNVDRRPQFGTQSGPMLVIDGELHPEIDPDGESLRIRNGVGVDSAGRAIFVISETPISFGKLARFYRDVLSVSNALYLDGTVSAVWIPDRSRLDSSLPIGPLIVVEKRANAPVEEEADAT